MPNTSLISQIKVKLPLAPYLAPFTNGLRPSKSSPKFQVGQCPFCSKKKKFWVNTETNSANCFYCQFPHNLDIISFHQNYYQRSISDAIHRLAIIAGLEDNTDV